MSPQDFKAAIELKATVLRANKPKDWMDFKKTLYEQAIPYAGITIKKIFTLGLTVEFNIHADALVWGDATVTFGARMTVPDDAKIHFDLVNYKKTQVSGFDGVEVKPVHELNQASLNANFRVGPELALTFGVDVLEKTGIEADLNFGVPRFNFNATAGYNKDGFCGGKDKVTTGVKAESGAAFDCIAAVNAKPPAGDKKTLWTYKIMNIPIKKFFSVCKSLPGITPPTDGKDDKGKDDKDGKGGKDKGGKDGKDGKDDSSKKPSPPASTSEPKPTGPQVKKPKCKKKKMRST